MPDEIRDEKLNGVGTEASMNLWNTLNHLWECLMKYSSSKIFYWAQRKVKKNNQWGKFDLIRRWKRYKKHGARFYKV